MLQLIGCTVQTASRKLAGRLFSTEALEFRQQVKAFARQHIFPHAEKIDRDNDFPTTVNLWREVGVVKGNLGVGAKFLLPSWTSPLSLSPPPSLQLGSFGLHGKVPGGLVWTAG